MYVCIYREREIETIYYMINKAIYYILYDHIAIYYTNYNIT